MTNITALRTSTQSPNEIADGLRDLADRIENGGLPGVENVTVLVEDRNDLIAHALFGRPRNSAELTGMLFTIATHSATGQFSE